MTDGRLTSQWIPAASVSGGYRRVAAPGNAPLAFLEFGLVNLDRERPQYIWEARDREAVFYLIGGACEVAVSGAAGALSAVLDSRLGVFEGPPAAAYVPAGATVRLTCSNTRADLAVFAARPREARPPRVIRAREVVTKTVGSGNWTRQVTSVVDDRIASRLLIGETINPAGHWSSYPPHKHDANVPSRECPMEEVYHFFASPPGGFGLQMVYTAPTDPQPFQEIYRVGDRDTVVIPRGYHPVVAAAGYRLAYLWAISGERVQYAAWAEDPAHAWVARER